MMAKKATVVMLPTEKADGIIKQWNDTLYTADKGDKRILTHHLYFTIKEEIGEDKYCYNYKRNRIEFTRIMKDTCEWVFCNKIVATTNPDLWIPRLIPDAEVPLPAPIAKIPTDFLEAYVREQGKITEVMLEYTVTYYAAGLPFMTEASWLSYLKENPTAARYKEVSGIKLRQNGTVIIHPVNNQEKIWREVFQLFADNMIREQKYTQQEWLEVCQKNWTIKEK